ncbi:hypothetical protein AURDEDRAFT_24872, partial [Auricularia subglabra TFB-10046 SS5]
KYPPPLTEMLKDAHGRRKAVLDLGCGTGAWLADIVTDFPHVEAVGVDRKPPQITTEVDDINLGLEHFYGKFDVVGARLISAGVKDYGGLVDQISRILHSDGLAVICECDFHVYNEQLEAFPPLKSLTLCSPSLPTVARLLGYLRRCLQARGGHVDAAFFLRQWIDQHHAFREVVHRDVYIPLCPFMRGTSEDARQQRSIAMYAREDASITSGRSLLLKSDLPKDQVDGLISQARQELAECRTPCFMRLQCVYARK